MKRIINYLIIAVSIICLASCSSKKSEDTKEDIKEELNFSKVVANGDFAEAHELLNIQLKDVDDFHTKDDLFANINLLYKAEAIELIAGDAENTKTNLTLLLLEYPMVGNKVKDGLQDYSAYDKRRNPYDISLAKFNSLCDDLLTAAIALKKYELAQIIIDSYKEDCSIFKGEGSGIIYKDKGIKVDGNNSYIEYSWDSKNAAQKKLAEAMKNSK